MCHAGSRSRWKDEIDYSKDFTAAVAALSPSPAHSSTSNDFREVASSAICERGEKAICILGRKGVDESPVMTYYERQKKPKLALLSQVGFLAPINSQVCLPTRAVNASGYHPRPLIDDETNWPRFLLPTVTDTLLKTWAIPSGICSN